MGKPTSIGKLLVMSYLPGFYDAENRAGENVADEIRDNPDKLKKIFANLIEGTWADACLWTDPGGPLQRAAPVLAFPDAKGLYDHLLYWSENQPNKWFRLYFAEQEEPYAYAVALVPRLDRSEERLRLSWRIKHHGRPVGKVDSVEYIFSFLSFVTAGQTFKQIKSKIGRQCRVGLVNTSLVNRDNPGELDSAKVLELEPINVRWVEGEPKNKVDKVAFDILRGTLKDFTERQAKEGEDS